METIRRRMRLKHLVLLSGLLIAASHCGIAAELCRECHPEMNHGLAGHHHFEANACTQCHAGDGDAESLPGAHQDLIAFPGNLSGAERACGNCHPTEVASVTAGFMHRGTHMVQLTRRALDGDAAAGDPPSLQSLAASPADSLLRKLCASCHLGHEKREHRLDVSFARGGGCLACHLNSYPADAHPMLTAKVEDGRCFGCHSRSSRVSLSYAGLAEVDRATSAPAAGAKLASLEDGRLVEHRAADLHHRAGMACIDCHTGAGLMGPQPAGSRQAQAVDIACSDCHANRRPRIRPADWPQEHRWMLTRIPFAVSEDSVFLTTRRGTPLWHIEVAADGLKLHLKLSDQILRIPPQRAESHRLGTEHRRLTCNACHAQWVPQCYACHLSFSPDGTQWDHVEDRFTAGRWSQQRAGVRNALGPLGVTADDRITSFVPGMIMTVDHPAWERPRFRRLFGALAPHTTGRSRSCQSCHRSPVAVGLGEGELYRQGGEWRFTPAQPALEDGLPADAWTRLGAETPGLGSHPGDRWFDDGEIRRILSSDSGSHAFRESMRSIKP